jgi:hypothetical protein
MSDNMNICPFISNWLTPTTPKLIFLGALTAGGAIAGASGAAITGLACVTLRKGFEFYQAWMKPRYLANERYDALTRGCSTDLSFEDELLESSALQGDRNARAQFGALLVNGYLVNGKTLRNEELAVTYFTQAANDPSTNLGSQRLACWNLAQCYYFGIGTEKNVEKAQEFFRQIPFQNVFDFREGRYAIGENVSVEERQAFFLQLARPEDVEKLKKIFAQ